MRIASILALPAAIFAAGCGSSNPSDGGPSVDRAYPVGAFQGIEVAGPYDVQVRSGGAPSVRASGPEELIERLVVEVKNGKLLIRSRKDKLPGWSSVRGTARIEVTAPELRSATVAGSGDIAIDRVGGDSFEGGIAGSGNLKLQSVAVRSLKLAIGGSGSVQAGHGTVRDADFSIAGSGDIQSGGVRAENAKISIAGSGSVNGQATRAADVSIMGSGDVSLSGGAKCSVSKMGSGEVRCS